ncbi:hypothetical protein ACIP46_17520 [Streptomyces lavendulae]|uniref:hypothetical protein n=1 Tax=Streptomyces lavendulae TaxID=1914 RepID=UPI0037F5ABDE
MRHVRSVIDSFTDHALHAAGTVLSWHPSPEVRFLGQVVQDLASSEAVRLWVRTTAQVYRARLMARMSRRADC